MKRILIYLSSACLIFLCSCTPSADGGGQENPPVNSPDTSVTEDPASPGEQEDPVGQGEPGGGDRTDEPADGIPVATEYNIENGPTPRMLALSRLNTGNRARLAEKLKKAEDGGELTVAYMGGSITQGTGGGNNGCYARLTQNWFEQTYPDAKTNYLNAGIGATGSYIGVFRADKDVIAYRPDIVFVEFSVNDTTEHTERNKNSYDSLIRKLWLSPSAPAVITVAMTQENGASFQQYHEEIAKFYDIPMISYKNAILDVIASGYIKWTDISGDNIHPNSAGHRVLSELLIDYLNDANENSEDISGAESDFSTSYTGDQYADARQIKPGDTEITSSGAFAEFENSFGNIKGYWRLAADGEIPGGGAITAEVEAKSIALFFGKLTGSGGRLEIIVDGKTEKTVNTAFPNGWGNYVEVEEIVTFSEKGTHTVEIRPLPAEDGGKANFVVSAIAVS
ncbi:MAG: GDSL-type esterase/lipase family protein [Oscillospiraceae bacterium]|jgi:lysophospholipase L1-like esterase|nr:GDSL-type esterase/lipase family protein [Oscillospiraceae bacterium]